MKAVIFILAALAAAQLPGSVLAQPVTLWYEVSGGSWRVPARMVAEMRSQISEGAREAVAASAEKEIRSLKNDTVQYQGFNAEVTKKKFVEISGMCETAASPAALRKNWIVNDEETNCFYGALYDPARKKFVAFFFNDSAR